MSSPAQLRTRVLPCQKNSCHKERLPAFFPHSARQPLRRRTERCPSLQLRAIWAQTRALQQQGARCHGCPKLSRQPRLWEGLRDSTSLALARGTAYSSGEQTCPETLGCPYGFSHPEAGAALSPLRVQVRALGKQRLRCLVLGKGGYPQDKQALGTARSRALQASPPCL